MDQQTSYNLLSYFQNLLESNKLDFLRDTALNDIAERYGTLVESRDVEKGIIKYWGVFSDQHSNGEPVEAIVTYDFYKELIEEVVQRLGGKQNTMQQPWVTPEQAMELLNIKSKTTFSFSKNHYCSSIGYVCFIDLGI